LTPAASEQFVAHNRAERVIAAGRVLLAACSLVTLWLTPDGRPPLAMLYLLGAYGTYAIGLGVVSWITELPPLRLRLLAHVVDVVVFSLMYVLESQLAGSFFVFFIFSLLSATLRWQWRGTLTTAAIALVMALAMGAYQTMRSESFVASQFMIRGIYVVVLSVLVSYVVAYELHLRRTLSRLAAWPPGVPDHFHGLLRSVLQEAAGTLGATRMLIAWRDPSGPWLMLAEWTADGFSVFREAPETYGPVVDERLSDTDFYCDAIGVAPVVVRVGDRFRRWALWPLPAGLCAKFAIRSALSVKLSASGLDARLFWLDKRKIITDDLILARLVAREATAHIDQFHLIEQRKRAAGADERIQLARNLHDGLLQSLTAIALKLEELRDMLAETSHGSEKNVVVLQRLILAEQRYLRHFIGHLKPMGDDPLTLDARLRLLTERVELEWNVAVELRWPDGEEPVLPLALVDEVYYIVSEAVVNAARHSSASLVSVEIATRADDVLIVVADNGTGFPFRGRYDEGVLEREAWGPAVLRARVAALSGRLSIESTDQGSRLEVTLPFLQIGVGRAD
jgi:signal transduction histidine kinase